ncbi:hypothetical protein SEA_DALANDE_33 [Gordonia phage DalanDe]|nr:hypothetical protein SEA_DALANDE_33 [Gordonia phage DalanDe]
MRKAFVVVTKELDPAEGTQAVRLVAERVVDYTIDLLNTGKVRLRVAVMRPGVGDTEQERDVTSDDGTQRAFFNFSLPTDTWGYSVLASSDYANKKLLVSPDGNRTLIALDNGWSQSYIEQDEIAAWNGGGNPLNM